DVVVAATDDDDRIDPMRLAGREKVAIDPLGRRRAREDVPSSETGARPDGAQDAPGELLVARDRPVRADDADAAVERRRPLGAQAVALVRGSRQLVVLLEGVADSHLVLRDRPRVHTGTGGSAA